MSKHQEEMTVKIEVPKTVYEAHFQLEIREVIGDDHKPMCIHHIDMKDDGSYTVYVERTDG